jgi:hypothetical protein
VNLQVSKGVVYELNVISSPYVTNKNIVQLYPSETIYLEAQEINGKLELTPVKQILNRGKTIIISFKQETKNGEHENMNLKIVNPFNRALAYAASVYLMKNNQWINTDVEHVNPSLSSLEVWKDIILSIALTNWRFKDG